MSDQLLAEDRKKQLWIKLALFNLCIVALLGTLMRYKIGFEFPYFNQKYLQEAHSHFAFTGWITHTIYVLVFYLFQRNALVVSHKIYGFLIWGNLLCSYGMLFSFAVQGYGPVSITFSTISVLIGYVFAFHALKDIRKLPALHPSRNWLRAAIWFGIFSTLGTMVLSYMMANRLTDQTTYLGSIYFYLHFQYNGWFLFACFGIFLDWIRNFQLDQKLVRRSFWLFFIAGVPSFFLSTLWAELPLWLYIIVIVAAIIQSVGWVYFIMLIRPHVSRINSLFAKPAGWLFLIVALALTVKLFLQLISVEPYISTLAFGFRTIVIAYLHLILLLIISVFLLTFLYGTGMLSRAHATVPLLGFVSGVILTELILAVQGIASFSYTVIPYADTLLFLAACLILASGIFLLAGQFRKSSI